MGKINIKGHVSMFAANTIWGLMSPVAKIVMAGGIVSPLVVTDLRVFGAMVMFWIVSFFRKPEHVAPADMVRLFGASLLAIVLNQGSFIFGVSLTTRGLFGLKPPLWCSSAGDAGVVSAQLTEGL